MSAFADGIGPTIHEFPSARLNCCRQTRGWSCQARPWLGPRPFPVAALSL